MAKENDEVQHNNSSNCSSSSNNNNGIDMLPAIVGVPLTSDETEAANVLSSTDCAMEMKMADVAATSDKGKVNNAGGGDYADNSSTRSDQYASSTTTFMRGKLNDLVADLCINGPMSCGSDKNGGYGDYTQISSATHAETSTQQKIAGCTWESASNSSIGTQQHVPQPHAAPTQNSSSFSFKHFLSSGPPITAPSSTVTVTTLDAAISNNANGNQSINANTASSNAASLQTSTGARPKVPQSTSLSSTSISSLISSGGATTGISAQQDGTSATKMKRSPRFSSFDSQASLAEFVTVDADAEAENVSSTTGSGVRVGPNTSTGFRLYPESSDFFSSAPRIRRGMDGDGVMSNTNEYDRHQYVPRSYSNYEMPMSSSAASPRRRVAVGKNVYSNVDGGTKEARPTRLALNTNSSKSKVNLPLGDMSSSSGTAAAAATAPPVTRPLPSNAGEFPAAVLPDFVQDHWLDSWYAHEMHLSSPPNSPIPDYNDDDVGGGAVGGGNNGGVRCLGVSAVIGIPGPSSPTYGGVGACGGGGGAGGGDVTAEATASNAKMLPDFLSDGPIIHSSQRLADVTVGLPSNSIGSPDDPPMSSQLSRLRIENERLQRELNDARIALNEQTLHANALERQLQHTRELQQKQQLDEVNPNAAESVADRSKRMRSTTGTTTQNYVTELKQQVTQLTSEVKALRRENETLREEGAVGGFNAPYCDRSRSFPADGSGGASGSAGAGVAAGVAARGAVGRPSRTQQISRDLLRAASNAENNLRQLLVGVDNLRQMAADIENSDNRLGYDVSPDLFSDFLEDCDDYEDYSDGPTL